MVSDTNTKRFLNRISNKLPSALPSYARIRLSTPHHGHKKYHPARMMLTVLGINLIPLTVLIFCLALISDHRERLINNELELLYTRTRLYAQIISTSDLLRDNQPISAQAAIALLDLPMEDYAVFFTTDGTALINTENTPINPLKKDISFAKRLAGNFISSLMQLTQVDFNAPQYPQTDLENPKSFPGVTESQRGLKNIAAWTIGKEQLLFSSSVPVSSDDGTEGILSITHSAQTLTAQIAKLQEDIFRIFVSILTLSIAFSLYLVGTITNPLRRLAKSAESIRFGSRHGAQEIPDMSNRGDEIGELSIALNGMVEALWERMGTIESFAADVSHELKNPITSIKSALETLQKVKSEKDKKVLLKILEHDIDRLDRLITDISKSTRLDVELSQGSMERLNISNIMQDVHGIYQLQHHYDQLDVPIEITDKTAGKYFILGRKEKLLQVFTNIVDNALSFSHKGDTVSILIHAISDQVTISVQDMGVGLPDKKLEKIFERFYSDRPKKEGAEHHSGLGLSIVKQIIKAHDGVIEAENLKNSDGEITGASFNITFPIYEVGDKA